MNEIHQIITYVESLLVYIVILLVFLAIFVKAQLYIKKIDKEKKQKVAINIGGNNEDQAYCNYKR